MTSENRDWKTGNRALRARRTTNCSYTINDEMISNHGHISEPSTHNNNNKIDDEHSVQAMIRGAILAFNLSISEHFLLFNNREI